MHSKKLLKKFLIASLAAGSLIFTPEIYGLPTSTAIVHAEIKEYVGVGESIISDRETLEIGKQGAKLLAIRNAQEKAGVFIGSYSVVKNNELDTDEIVAFTAGIVQIKGEVKYEPIPLGDALGTMKYRATVVVTIDTDDLTAKINQWLGINSQTRSDITQKNTELNNTLDAIKTRTAELETEVLGASMTVDNATVKEELKQIDRDILYAQKISEGNERLRNGDRDGAMKLYQEAIALYPKDATIAYEKVGDNYRDAKNYIAAIDAYTKVIQMDPNYSVPYFKRGKIYFELKDYRKAVADFEKVIKLAPHSYEAYWLLYKTYRELGDYHSALVCSDKAVAQKFGYDSFDSISKYLRLIVEYTKAIESGSASAKHYFERGKCFWELRIGTVGKDNKVLADFGKAIELAPNNGYYLYKRGELYFKREDFRSAATDFEKSIKVDPELKSYTEGNTNYFRFYDRYEMLGECYEKLGYKSKAIELYTAASKDKRLNKYGRNEFKEKLKALQKSK